MKKRILVIEDNKHIRENISEILTLAGYSVLLAADGKEGVEKAQKLEADLILCDIMMPVLDGFGVLHILHMDTATQNIPFIFITSKSERNDFRTAMEMGADDYITKPFNSMELLNAIESRLQKVDILKKNLTPDLNGLDELIGSVDKTLSNLAHDRQTNAYKKKQLIYAEGNDAHCLYYLLKGKIKTFKTNHEGKELTIGLYNEGDFMGYIALLEDTAHNESAMALEDAELALIPKKDFQLLLHNNFGIARKFISMLAKNLTEKEQQLLNIAYNTLRRKVAAALISLQQKYQTNPNEPYYLDVSREDLATIAGAATESVIRTLSEFKDEKLVDISDGKVRILNQKLLENLLR